MIIFSNEKSFRGILCNPLANRLGLHVLRILMSDFSCFIRKIPFILIAYRQHRKLAQDGVIIIENFADETEFQAICSEIKQALNSQAMTPDQNIFGFGQKNFYTHGFDRYDGSSLNRFVEIDQYPHLLSLVQSKKMNKLTLALFGMLNKTKKYYAYELIHGDHAKNPDSQKYTHKDTFHSTYKLWYFIEDISLDLGPFEYAYGSHRSTWQRIKWEYQMSCKVSSQQNHPNKTGSFRVSDEELEQMQITKPISLLVKANSLVIANTKGFHCRGDAPIGSRRIGLYANFRPIAFLPFLH